MIQQRYVRATAFALATTLFFACAHQRNNDDTMKELTPRTLGSIDKLTTQGGYWFASQPSQEDFALVEDAGIKTVINLRLDRELPWEERRVVEGLGMKYVHEPIAGVADLTDERLVQLRALLRDAEKPVMVHCGSSNRVGAIWYVSRVLDQGVSPDVALDEARRAGLRSEALVQRVQKYVADERSYRGF